MNRFLISSFVVLMLATNAIGQQNPPPVNCGSAITSYTIGGNGHITHYKYIASCIRQANSSTATTYWMTEIVMEEYHEGVCLFDPQTGEFSAPQNVWLGTGTLYPMRQQGWIIGPPPTQRQMGLSGLTKKIRFKFFAQRVVLHNDGVWWPEAKILIKTETHTMRATQDQHGNWVANPIQTVVE